MRTAHTPSPWEAVQEHFGSWEIRSCASYKTPLVLQDLGEDDARFIVTACNAHEELKRELIDMTVLAHAAMQEANRDGAEYDITAELATANALLSRMEEK